MKVKKTSLKVMYHLMIILLGASMIYPVLWMVSGSLKNNVEILNGGLNLIPPNWRFDNYITGWQGFAKITFATFFKNSFIITVLATIGTVLSSAAVAYSFTRLYYPGRKLLFMAMIGTMMLPSQIILIPQYIIYNRLGAIGTYIPLILPHYFGQAFFIFQMMQFIKGIPKDFDEAATIDGCNRYSIFTRIIMPLLKPALITSTIIQFYWKWDDFMGPLVYLNRPNTFTVAIALKLFADASSITDYGAMFAMSTLSLIPVFVIFLAFNKRLVEGISATGLKA